MPTYRERVDAMYRTYAPNKRHTVDNALETYKGQEEDLIAHLVGKYGPEPAMESPQDKAFALAVSSPNPTLPQSTEDSSALRSHNNTFSNIPMAMSMNAADFGETASLPDTREENPYHHLKTQLSMDTFAHSDYEKQYVEAWAGKVPRGIILKFHSSEILLSGYCAKAVLSGIHLKSYEKRWVDLLPPFLYFYENENGQCKSVVYLHKAIVTEGITEDKAKRKFIEIESTVSTQPPKEFYICRFSLESQKVHEKWLHALEQVSQIEPKIPGASGVASSTLARAQSQTGMTSNASPRASIPMSSPQGALQHSAMTPSVAPSQPKSSFSIPVGPDDLKARIRRLASERDPCEVADVLFQVISDEIDDGNVLWRTMDKIETLRRVSERSPARPAVRQGGNANSGNDNVAGTPANAEVVELRAAQNSIERRLDMMKRQGGDSELIPPNKDPSTEQAPLNSEWQQRVDRMKSRKHAMDRIMEDLPK